MDSKRISGYINFGTSMRYLQDAKKGVPVHGDGRILDNINRFLDYLDEFNLHVTARAAHKLRVLRDGLQETVEENKLTPHMAVTLAEIMNDIRNTLFAEAHGRIAFIVTDKRIDVHKLLSNIQGLLAPRVFNDLPTIAQSDLTEAGRCVAFELPTAAAFHLLRGTEAVLRHFYCSVVRRNRVSPLLWGPMVSSMRQRRKPPNETLLNNLDNIRRSFRNPTQHPEKCYDIEEVQDLFNLCVDVINRMVSSGYWTT